MAEARDRGWEGRRGSGIFGRRPGQGNVGATEDEGEPGGRGDVSGYLFEALAGFLVWLVANVVYLDMVRGGTRGLRRLVAFWFGAPTTFLTLILVKEGSRFRVEPPPDDEDALLAEIRRDRRLRGGPGPHPSEEERQ